MSDIVEPLSKLVIYKPMNFSKLTSLDNLDFGNKISHNGKFHQNGEIPLF